MLQILRKKLSNRGLSAPIYEMDASNFSIPEKFDLILFPFNSFSELVTLEAQQNSLRAMSSHLTETGRAIFTFHNPTLRRQRIDGQVHLMGQFPLPETDEILFLSSVETGKAHSNIVTGSQFYEIYSADGELKAKRFVDVEFFLHTKTSFEALIFDVQLEVEAIYGDYDRAVFDADSSPFMIFVLTRKRGKATGEPEQCSGL
jgi:hypothetical protein